MQIVQTMSAEGGELTNRERVMSALRHRRPDRIPYDIRFTKPAHAAMARHYGTPDFDETLGHCFTWLRP